MLETLGEKPRVDLQIHHFDPWLVKEIIENNLGVYHYYVIMPHFFQHAVQDEYLSVLKLIPEGALILLDKFVAGWRVAPEVSIRTSNGTFTMRSRNG